MMMVDNKVDNKMAQNGESWAGTSRALIVGVAGSILATILINVFGYPLLRGMNLIIVWIASHLYHGYVDSQYKQAALGLVNAMLFELSTIVYSLCAGVSLGIATAFLIGRRGKRHAGVKNIAENPSDGGARFVERFLRMFVSRYAGVFFAVAPLLIMLQMAAHFTEVQASSSFDLRLRALSPYITEHEEKVAVGRWAIMKSRQDYDDVNQYLDALAKKYSVNIPPPLI